MLILTVAGAEISNGTFGLGSWSNIAISCAFLVPPRHRFYLLLPL